MRGQPTRFLRGHWDINYVKNFWAKVNKRGPDECWPWTGKRSETDPSKGYGRICIRYRIVAAHRFSYEMAIGPIPSGLQVCHRCDNPPCVNPAHLFLGTWAENMKDKVRKGRCRTSDRRGELSPRAKITTEMVLEIRRLSGPDWPNKRLCVRFGLSHAQVSRIVHRKAWPHIA